MNKRESYCRESLTEKKNEFEMENVNVSIYYENGSKTKRKQINQMIEIKGEWKAKAFFSGFPFHSASFLAMFIN